MKSISSPKLSGKFFFARLKKKDKFYFMRLSERYRDLRDNVTKSSQLSEQEMFLAYLDIMAQNQEKIKKMLSDFVTYFNTKNIPYVLVGGLAVNFWGRIRSTMDADFIIDDKKLNHNDFVNYLLNKGYEITIDDIKRGFYEKLNVTIW